MTYDQAGVNWLRQLEGNVLPVSGETAVYWPDIDCTDILESSSIRDDVKDDLFGSYRSLCGDEWQPIVTER